MFGKKRKEAAAEAAAHEKKSKLTATDGEGRAVADAELTAVIAAAVAAYESDAVRCDVVFRKIDRTAGPRTEWNLAGLREVLVSRSI
jgi:hypothetical protein